MAPLDFPGLYAQVVLIRWTEEKMNKQLDG